MVTITLKGREIPLLYTTWEMKQIQEEIAPFSKALKMFMGHNPENEEDADWYGCAEHINAVAKLIRLLGNAGLEEAGKEPDLTDKKILRAIKPGEFAGMINECMNAMAEGMNSEIPEKKQEGPVDVTLEEMKKKETKEN